ncbi:hypothetical protein QBC43DRAFT_338088 [Cladorrhinum sp. PSN259]|nr:hypothetical protein QBC43DRAFT_338088 [Cladorrhinum sp. PSN259]
MPPKAARQDPVDPAPPGADPGDPVWLTEAQLLLFGAQFMKTERDRTKADLQAWWDTPSDPVYYKHFLDPTTQQGRGYLADMFANDQKHLCLFLPNSHIGAATVATRTEIMSARTEAIERLTRPRVSDKDKGYLYIYDATVAKENLHPSCFNGPEKNLVLMNRPAEKALDILHNHLADKHFRVAQERAMRLNAREYANRVTQLLREERVKLRTALDTERRDRKAELNREIKIRKTWEDMNKATVEKLKEQIDELKEQLAIAQAQGAASDTAMPDAPDPEEPLDAPENKWIDVRMRTLHSHTTSFRYADLKTPAMTAAKKVIAVTPNHQYNISTGGSIFTGRFEDRYRVINNLIHGGDLKNDCRIVVDERIKTRHDENRNEYFRLTFAQTYGEIKPADAGDILKALEHDDCARQEVLCGPPGLFPAADRQMHAASVSATNVLFAAYMAELVDLCRDAGDLSMRKRRKLGEARYRVWESVNLTWPSGVWRKLTNLGGLQQRNSAWNKPGIASYLAAGAPKRGSKF